MAEGLDAVGLSYPEVRARPGLPDRHLDVAGERVTVAEYFSLWDAIHAASGDPGVGIRRSQTVKADPTEPLFLAMSNSRRVGDALEVLSNYKRMLSAERVELEVDGSSGAIALAYVWPPGEREPPQVLVDAEPAFVVEALRLATRTPALAATEVRLCTRTLPEQAGHAAFFRCPVRLGAVDDGISFAPEDVARPS